MAKSIVITKGRGTVKHYSNSPAGATLCGIAAANTMKAGGPALKRAMCAACAAQAKSASK